MCSSGYRVETGPQKMAEESWGLNKLNDFFIKLYYSFTVVQSKRSKLGKYLRVLQSLVQFWQTHVSAKFLEQNLHKDSTGGCCCVFTHSNAFKDLEENMFFFFFFNPYFRKSILESILMCCLKHNYSLQDEFIYRSRLNVGAMNVNMRAIKVTYTPWNRVCVKEMSKDSSNVTQFVGFKPVDCFILLLEDCLKTLHVFFLQQAKPLH